MGWVSTVTVRELLKAPLPPQQGGYAALVFIASRPEGDGKVHRQHLHDWSGIHDLTGRHVAVLTPVPNGAVVINRGIADRGAALFRNAGTGLVIADPLPHSRKPTYAPKLSAPIDDYATAVTILASELQDYFGIAEDALPCAVIVCTREREVIMVGLNRRITVYGLFKHVKSVLEPELSRLNNAKTELDASADVVRRAEAELDAARRRVRAWSLAVAARKGWVDRRAQVVRELIDLTTAVNAETADLCRWLASRLTENRGLDSREVARAEPLLTALGSRIGNLSSRERRSLMRRVRRTVANLGTEATQAPEEPADDLAGLSVDVARSRATYNELSSTYSVLGRLNMLDAVRTAADRLGLEESHSGLLPWRETPWPVTAFTEPPHRAPSVRKERG